MSLIVPSTSDSDGDVPHSWDLVAELAWLNGELTKQKSPVSVKTVALHPCEGYRNHADFVVVYKVGDAKYEYLVPVERSKLTKTTEEWHNIMGEVLRDINENVTVFLPALRTLKGIRPNRKCEIHFDWGESGELKVFVLVHLNNRIYIKTVQEEFRYDRQAFVDAYKLKRLEDALFEQLVYFVGDGAKVAFEEACKPMCRKSMPVYHGTKRARTHHGALKISKKPKKARNSVDV
jgi:hypothetical protein